MFRRIVSWCSRAVAIATALLRKKTATKYAKGREEFDLHFEDEADLERRLHRQRKIKRRVRRAIAFIVAFLLGVSTSYLASAMWTVWPLVPVQAQTQDPAVCKPSEKKHAPQSQGDTVLTHLR